MKRPLLTVAALLLMGTSSTPLFAAKAKRLDTSMSPIVVRPAERTVTIDFKDAEAKVILKAMQKQCGVKNLILDPGVEGKGTFLFYDVPCRQAFRVVLRSLGLDARTYSGSMVNVGVPKH